MRVQRGFGLIEVLVALAIVAIAGGTLFSWINQSLTTAARLQRIEAESQLLLDAQALVADVNPAQQAEGARELPPLRVQWSAKALTPLSQGMPSPEGPIGRWQLALFATHVDAQDIRSGARVAFDIVQHGLLPRTDVPSLAEQLRAP
ncbi:MAG: type II secretion system protein [Rubrivivax sp.]|nr:type II secretion system protein [Rubrivivax sp.]